MREDVLPTELMSPAGDTPWRYAARADGALFLESS